MKKILFVCLGNICRSSTAEGVMLHLAPSPEEWKKIHRMTEYCTRIPADHVPDPYYGGAEGFEYVLDVLEDACAGLLTSLTQDN